MSWIVQQHVENRLTFEHLIKTLQDSFGIPIKLKRIFKLKSSAATCYKSTYNKILENILKSKVIHIDETKIKLQKTSGYVWVLTNLIDVYYIYRANRETDFLHSLLKNFDGILISDFYPGYDSLKCLQQKCLLHLIRDINLDLLKYPFDQDLNEIGKKFGEVLRGIILTIDRFGLKCRFLRKHKKDVERLFKDIQNDICRSSIAEKLNKRLNKYRSKLFMFLDYDGVPWNNNNAEHAIKPFTKYRRIVDQASVHRNSDAQYEFPRIPVPEHPSSIVKGARLREQGGYRKGLAQPCSLFPEFACINSAK